MSPGNNLPRLGLTLAMSDVDRHTIVHKVKKVGLSTICIIDMLARCILVAYFPWFGAGSTLFIYSIRINEEYA